MGKCLSAAPHDKPINMSPIQRTPRHVTHKLLLLGPGESGKTTIFNQLRRIYGADFSASELRRIKPFITQNIIEAMRTLAIYSELFHDQGFDTKVDSENEEIRTRVARMNDREKFTKIQFDDCNTLWHDIHIRNVLKYRHRIQLSDTCDYFFDRMDNYWRDDYIPTFEDLIRCRRRSTGIGNLSFKLSNCDNVIETYEIYAPGGQKTERRKWIQLFNAASAVIFVAALSGYNQYVWENPTNNRLKEAINLFRNIVNLDAFNESHIILFLNKSDLFCQKIGKYSVKEHFENYTGNDDNKDEVINFFKEQFNQQLYKSIQIHFHITCATDTMCVKKMFQSIRSIVLKTELVNNGFM